MTSIAMTIHSYMQAKNQLEQMIKDDREKAAKEIFGSIFLGYPGLNRIALVGYTPSFNDGDPCEHDGFVFTGYSDDGIPDYEYELSMEDELDEFFFEDGEERIEPFNQIESEKIDRDIVRAVMAFDDIIHQIYGTNYLLKVSYDRDTETVSVEEDEYDCGH